MKKYIVTLTAEERQTLSDRIAAGKAAAQKLAHARILLKADAAEGGPAWPDARIAEAVEVSIATVERVRHRFVTWAFVFSSIRISSGQGRVNPSLGHLRVASTPIFEPKSGSREA